MSALGKVVRAGVGRRRVQTVVMVLTTMTAVTASVMAGGLVVASQGPFDHAFARQHGAHLAARFDGAKATAAQVAATARAQGVTAAAGPYAVVSAAPRLRPPGGTLVLDMPPMSIAGRADPGGPVDRLALTSGRWAKAPGEIVLATDGHVTGPRGVGSTLTFPALRGAPALKVVGIADSVSQTAEAWVVPAQIAALTAPGRTPSYEMLYRFQQAGTAAQISRDRAALAAADPRRALTGAQSYLALRETANRETAIFVPFIVAFGILALVMSVLIIGIVVGGAVSAGTRRIGVLKSLGFTPAQVGRAYVAQALIPASAGTALGVVLGNLASAPLLAQADDAYGTTSLHVAWWLDAVVPAAVLALVVVSALTPALRAARLRTVEAIAVGRTPRVGRGRRAARLAAALPVGRAVSLGLAGPFARPARSATIGAAVVFGAVGVTFAFGLGTSLGAIQRGLNQDSPGQVEVGTMAGPDPMEQRIGGGGPSPHPRAADPAAVGRAIAAQSGTRGYFAVGETDVSVSGIAGSTKAVGYRGDSGWGTYQMISGHWFTGPGEAVVASRFLKAAGVRIGDTVALDGGGGRTVRVRIVGEALVVADDDGLHVLTDSRTLTRAGLAFHPDQFNVRLADGTDRARYLTALNARLDTLGAHAVATDGQTSSTVVAIDAMTAMLTLMLVAVAGLGVLNTVVLDTRERVHDLGVLKALGMAPRQTVAMVITSAAGIGAVAGLIGVPLGIALHGYVIPAMGDAAGTRIPPVDIAVYHAPQIAVLAAAGLVIAAGGALLPAGWAARTRTAVALRTE